MYNNNCIVYPIERYRPNDTRARYGILVQSTGLLISPKARTIIPLAQADSVLTHLPSLHVSTIVVSTLQSMPLLHRIPNRALPPERHGGVSSPQSSYTQSGVTARTTRGRVVSTIIVYPIERYRPNDTRACRLHNHRIPNRAFRPNDTRACRLHNAVHTTR